MERCQQRKHTNKFLRKRLDSGDHPLSHKSVAKENKTNKNSAVSYDLPLAEGFVPFESAGGVPWDCRYGKDDLGIVYVCARLKVLLTTEMSYKVHLATLPTGYRPRIPFSTTCGMRYSGDEGQPLCSHIDFYVNGDIYIFPSLTVTASQITIPPISFFGS